MNKTYNNKFGLDMVTVHPGEFFIDNKNIIHTLLGTCISVVLYSQRHKIGGLNHYMLPIPATTSSPLETESGRYGINAMELLINGLLKKGVAKKHLSAKIFGGGKVLRSLPGGDNLQHVGEKNIDFIQYFLAKERIPIIASDIGGNGGRKIYFFPETGKVLVAKIKATASLAISEEKYKQEITKPKTQNDVFLF